MPIEWRQVGIVTAIVAVLITCGGGIATKADKKDMADARTKTEHLTIQTTKAAAAVEALATTVNRYIEKTEKRDAKQESEILELRLENAKRQPTD